MAENQQRFNTQEITVTVYGLPLVVEYRTAAAYPDFIDVREVKHCGAEILCIMDERAISLVREAIRAKVGE